MRKLLSIAILFAYFEVSAPTRIILGPVGVRPPSTLNTSLIAYYKLDEASGNATDYEPTGTPQTLTDNNTVTSTTGIQGTSRFFTIANTEYLSAADSADLSVGNIDFSLAGWFNATAYSGDMVVCSQWNATGNQRSWRFFFNSAIGKMSFEISSAGTATDGTVTQASPSPPSTATWYFFAITHDAAANTMNISLNDGTVTSTSYSSGAFDSTSVWDIGARGAGTSPWGGAIDEIGFWKKVLSVAEITELYNAGAGKTCCPF